MKFPIEQEFKLTENFIEQYKNRIPPFGFNGLGEFVYMRTYSRIKEDGKNESWWETVRRVVEGVYTIQKQHIEDYNLGWNQMKAQKSAQEMYNRIYNFKMLPAGRSLWAMGTPLIMQKGLSESLYNCSFLSTNNIHENPGKPFANAMDFLMCGIGVGADVAGANKLKVKEPGKKKYTYQISDDREGWVHSLDLLINSFFGENEIEFDYSLVRLAGTPIKTFGGISAGPEPLKELHNKVRDILTKRIDQYFSARDITDIFNLIGKAVVAGNVRRSAEIILGNPDEEFLNLKNYEMNPERADFGWSSNNSIYADIGMDYSDIAERIANNGEPGVYWLKNAQKFGRMRETEGEYKDQRVLGLNPCFTGDMEILTEDGYNSLAYVSNFEKYNLIDAKGNIVEGKVRETGDKKVYILNLSTNKKIKCTADHILMDIFDTEIKAIDSKGKQLKPYLNYPVHDKYFTLLGFIQGDGDLGRLISKAHLGVEVNIGKNDQDILSLLEGHRYTIGKRSVYLQDVKEDLIKKGFDNNKLPERTFPYDYANWNQYQRASFLSGCFSANGTINNYGRICYKCTCRKFIEQLQGNLEVQFGIYSYITTNKSHPIKFSNGTYTVKESYDLNISDFESKVKFYNEINFYQQYKIDKLGSLLNSMAPFVRSIKYSGEETVYDFSIPDYHWGVVEGLVVHNCGEINLESSELCNLVEMFPNNHETLDDFKTTIKYAYLYAKSLTLLNTHWTETNRVMLRNRRIGLSMTGISQFLANKGFSALREWMKEGYDTAKKYDKTYSEWFAIPESIKITTIKPSGSISLLAGATPGIHFPESKYYIRRVRIASNSPFVPILLQSGFKIEPAVGQEDSTSVIEFPIAFEENIRTINEVSMWEQLNLAAFAQKYWSDNSVSITVTFKKDEGKDIANALNIFQFQLKAVSFLPKLEEGAYAQMPYEEITKEKYEDMATRLTPLDFTSMFSLESVGEKYCSNDGCGF